MYTAINGLDRKLKQLGFKTEIKGVAHISAHPGKSKRLYDFWIGRDRMWIDGHVLYVPSFVGIEDLAMALSSDGQVMWSNYYIPDHDDENYLRAISMTFSISVTAEEIARMIELLDKRLDVAKEFIRNLKNEVDSLVKTRLANLTSK